MASHTSTVRKVRTRTFIKTRNLGGRARLSIHKTSSHVYAQVIDDVKRVTVASASTTEKDLKSKLKSTSNKDAAATIGKLVAERALKNGIQTVVFDRSGYLYHGKVKALAEAAREAGLKF